MKKIILVLLSVSFLLLGAFILIRSDVIGIYEDRDVIKYEGRIYSNATELEWFGKVKGKYQKEGKIGEIKRQKVSPLFMWNFSSTKLPKGTSLYKTNEAKEGTRLGTIIAETKSGELLYYIWLPKE